MPRFQAALIPAVSDLARGLRELGVPVGVAGALVPELLLDARPARMTNHADVAVVVASLGDFESLKDRLADYGFARTRLPHRIRHRSGGLVDMLPFSESIAPEGRLQLQEGFVLDRAGFRQVVSNAVATAIDDGPTLPLAPLPLYALLKLVAFDERSASKDLAGVFHSFSFQWINFYFWKSGRLDSNPPPLKLRRASQRPPAPKAGTHPIPAPAAEIPPRILAHEPPSPHPF